MMVWEPRPVAWASVSTLQRIASVDCDGQVDEACGCWKFEMTITETSGQDLVGYQVPIELDAGDDVWAVIGDSCRNVGAFLPAGEALPFWVEQCDVVGQFARLWVKLPALGADSEAAIHLFLSEEGFVQNPAGVFEFFDDFLHGFPV